MGFLDDYEPVEDRLRAFWSEHPTGRVVTELLAHENGDYIVQAFIFTDHEMPAATGLAHDSYDALPQQMKASALETCETSAIGRALANLGYAPKGKRPSREEMSAASGPSDGDLRVAPDVAADASGGEGRDLGEGVDATPPGAPTPDELIALAGTPSKVIAAVNAAVGSSYKVADLRKLTDLERAAGAEFLRSTVKAAL
jgi:hypothetical protein